MVQDIMELCNSGSQVLHHHFDFGRFKTERMDVTLPVQVLSFGEPAFTKKEVSRFWSGGKFTQHWQRVRHGKTAGWNMSEALTSVPHLNTEEESRPEPVSNVTRETFECIGCLCTCHPQLVSHVWMKPTFFVFFLSFFFTDALAEKQGGTPAAPNYSSTASCRAVFWFM